MECQTSDATSLWVAQSMLLAAMETCRHCGYNHHGFILSMMPKRASSATPAEQLDLVETGSSIINALQFCQGCKKPVPDEVWRGEEGSRYIQAAIPRPIDRKRLHLTFTRAEDQRITHLNYFWELRSGGKSPFYTVPFPPRPDNLETTSLPSDIPVNAIRSIAKDLRRTTPDHSPSSRTGASPGVPIQDLILQHIARIESETNK